VKLVLTGFMGAGKSAVGKRVAERLGLPFVDLDERIEAAAGASVKAIFASGGEDEFRRVERAELRRALAAGECVIAAGGGTLVDPENLEAAREAALVVWLNPTFATIVSRIGALGKSDRPLFRDEATAFDLYRARLPSYRRAHLRLDIEPGEEVEQIASRLLLRVREHACSS
jgi:shikimate kinase